MADIFNFAILKAIPDHVRGERVNVGIIVFLKGRIDIRLGETGKLRALQDGAWEDYFEQVRARYMSQYKNDEPPSAFIQRISTIDPVIKFSDVSWLSVDYPEQYEARVKSILNTLVTRRKKDARPRLTQINAEISSAFRASQIMARKYDVLGEDKKVFSNVTISEEEELKADFVLKNGVYNVTVTLDLRRASVSLGAAALKGVVLHKSPHTLPGGVRKFALYAAPSGAMQFRPHIGILGDFADHTFNWLNPDDRTRYTHMMFDAINGPANYILN